MDEGENIESPLLSRAIERAQKKVETRNYDIRKHLLEYDDVLNKQRTFIYSRRDEILSDPDIINRVRVTTEEILDDLIYDYREGCKKTPDDARINFIRSVKESFLLDVTDIFMKIGTDPTEVSKELLNILKKELEFKDTVIGHERLNYLLRHLYIEQIDKNWQAHLENMEQLREAVYLRSYSQKNPLVEYKIEGSNLFNELIDRIREKVMNQVYRVRIESVAVAENREQNLNYEHTNLESFDGSQQAALTGRRTQNNPAIGASTVIRTTEKVGRNDQCPCGSGKKYKHCCGQ